MLRPIETALPNNPSKGDWLTLMLSRARYTLAECEQWITDCESYKDNTGHDAATPAQILDMKGTCGGLRAYIAEIEKRLRAMTTP